MDKKTARFQVEEHEGLAAFAVMLAPGTTIDVDAFSLMPDDAINGWRKDVVEMVRDNIKPGVLRWPGGCFASYYLWKDGTGSADKRPVRPSPHWGGFSYNDVGTLEYLNFCDLESKILLENNHWSTTILPGSFIEIELY